MRSVNVMELAAGMRPAGRLANPARVIQVVKTGIRVGLQRAREVLQMLAGMFAPAIR
jgi:hypothetical protein